jgi:tRNA modification GTPase
MESETIAAIATPIGRGGIGIIKISGPDAFNIADAIFRTKKQPCKNTNINSSNYTSHRIFYGHIFDPKTHRCLDEALLSMMPGPKSYTREDIVEINTHGGFAVINAVLHLVLQNGARLAEPGEFTKRAFLNGRIDLTQAEAVMDIINAKSDKALGLAANQMNGKLKDEVDSILNFIQDINAEIDAAIDFPEVASISRSHEILSEDITQKCIHRLGQLLETYERTHVLKSGINAIIIGKPNVGKSSLMNCLVKRDRVIVSPFPGTTRDFVEEHLMIEDLPVVLTDTAGLHSSTDPIEKKGIEKTYEYLEAAELVLFVIDVSRPLGPDDYEIFEKVKKRKTILVFNKSDLSVYQDPKEIFTELIYRNPTCALRCVGIDELEKSIKNLAINKSHDLVLEEEMLSPNRRHKILIEKCRDRLKAACQGFVVGRPLEVISIDIRDAVKHLEEIIGVMVEETVLDRIFERFCIGK